MAEEPEPPLCEICGTSEDVDSFCKTCEDMLCSACSSIHSKTPVTKNDEIIPLTKAKKDGLTEGVNIPVILCEKHPTEIVRMYCVSCEAFICTECLIGQHFNHSMMTLKDITRIKRQELLELKAVLMRKQQMYKMAMKTETRLHVDFNQSLDKIRQEIVDQKKKVIAELENICEDQLIEVLDLLRCENKRFEGSLKSLKANRHVLTTALDRILYGIESDDLTGMRCAKTDATFYLQRLQDSPPQSTSGDTASAQE